MISITVHTGRALHRSRAPMTLKQALAWCEHNLKRAREEGVVFIVWRGGYPFAAAVTPGGGSVDWNGKDGQP